MGKKWKPWQTLFSWAPKSLWMVTSAIKLKDACFLKKSYDKAKQCTKKQKHHFANKGPYSQSYGFLSSHVQLWELDCKEGWVPNNWCFQTVVLEKTWESQSLGQQGDQTNQPYVKSTWNIHWKDWCRSWSSNALATWCEEQTQLKRPWCWERLKAGGKGDDRGWDGWMASLTQ